MINIKNHIESLLNKLKKKEIRIIVDKRDCLPKSVYEQLKKMHKKGQYIGVDFAKGEGIACFGHLDKDGSMIVDKITKI